MHESKDPPSSFRWWVIALIALGVALRARAYLANRSLWLDELFVWTTLGESAPVTLEHWTRFLRPLGEGQVAAPGFVLLIQVVRALFGDSEFALRLLPFLAGSLALPLTARLFSRLVGPVGVAFAVAAIALAPSAIYYSSDLKPYSLDLLTTLVLLDLAVARFEAPRPRIDAKLWFAGAVAVFVSLPAVLVLAGVGVTFVLFGEQGGSHRLRIGNAMRAVSWAILFAIELSLLFANTHQDRYLREYWIRERAFPPLGGVLERIVWNGEALVRALADPTGLAELWGRTTWTTLVAAALASIGALLWIRSDRRLAVLLLAPVLLTSIAAQFERYPLQGRVLCFMVPTLLACVCLAIDRLSRIEVRTHGRIAAACALLLLVEPARGALERFQRPYLREEARPVLEGLRDSHVTGDTLYMSRLAGFAWGYYAPRLDLRDIPTITAPDIPDDRVEDHAIDLLARVERRGRVFLFMTHYYPEDDVRSKVVDALESRGARVLATIEAPAASITELDLSGVAETSR